MKEQILSEIQWIASEIGGRAPGMDLFAKETGIQPRAWRGRFWARRSDALREVGLNANAFENEKTEESLLLAHMARTVRHLGKIPTEDEQRLLVRSSKRFRE